MVGHATLGEYYGEPAVRARMLEYCGGSVEREPTSVYVAGMRAADTPFPTWEQAPRHPLSQLDDLLAAGADVARSLWDRAHILVHLDVDYLNIDTPSEAHTHPADVFYKIEPVYRAAQHVFTRYGLRPLALVTGRGYHFTGQVPLDSPVVDRLAALVAAPPAWLRSAEQRRFPWMTGTITSRQARAWAGTGMLVEFLAHQILRRARTRSPIPVVVNNTVVGTGEVGRECVSLDLSYAGDPLDVRHIRVAFGAYQKHTLRPDLSGAAAAHPPMVAVPRGEERIEHMLSHRTDLRHAARLARTSRVEMPDVTAGVARALDGYQASPLARFHQAFEQAVPATRSNTLSHRRPAAHRRLLPACVTRVVATPNDLLLQPSVIQHVTRALLADGLSPRDIATLIQARYDADHGWGSRWTWMDAPTRASFDVRVFSGMLMAGVDEAIDLNCRSMQEKGLCPGGECGGDLRTTRAQLLKAVRS